MAQDVVNPRYTRYHPKWHRERTPIFWWVRRPAYTKFIMRELTSVFVAYAALLVVVHVWSVGQGADVYARLTAWLGHPLIVALHVVVLVVVLFHTVTWLNLAPQAMAVRLGEWRVPSAVVLLAHYAAWLVASIALFWLLAGVG